MPWSVLSSHEQNVERFRHSVQHNRLASTYLFVGLPGIGKRLFAQLLAEALLCEQPPGILAACGACSACCQVQAQTHPDLIVIAKPADKAFIPVEMFIGDQDHRRQQGLVHDIGLKPFRGRRKVAIVDDADCLNQEGANSLLKTLEEPPPNSLLILIGTSQQQQLPTIVSRSQLIRFEPLSPEQVKAILANQAQLETEIPFEILAAAAEGSVARALQLADSEIFEFRNELLKQLASGDPGHNDFAKSVLGFVDAAGKEGALKRDRLVLIADFAISFFRCCYREVSELNVTANPDSNLAEAVQIAQRNWTSMATNMVAEICCQAIDRCLDLQTQVHANVSPANGVEAWLIELGQICRGKTRLLV